MAKGYPRTRFEIVNEIQSQQVTTSSVSEPVPLAMAFYTSDKGAENWRIFENLEDFNKLTGDISYSRHGQPQLTIAEELRAGAAVFCKRLVSDNAHLANATVWARVVQNKEANISFVYYYVKSAKSFEVDALDDDGNVITREVNNDDGTKSTVNVKETIDIKTFDQACQFGYRYNDEDGDFDPSIVPTASNNYTIDIPLFTITPMGRGTSGIYFRIVPELSNRTRGYTRYTFEVYDNDISKTDKNIENIMFTMNHKIIVDGVAQGMNPRLKILSTQIKVNLYEDGVEKLLNTLIETATITESGAARKCEVNELASYDFINGIYKYNAITKTNVPLGGVVTIATANQLANRKVTVGGSEKSLQDLWNTSIPNDIKDSIIDLAADTGIALNNGDYGTLGSNPMNNNTKYSSEYNQLIINALSVEANTNADGDILPDHNFDPTVYDLDRIKLDFICDCGYDINVKKQIIDFVNIREDLVYLADLGYNVSTLTDIKNTVEKIGGSEMLETGEIKDYASRYTAFYCNTCKVYDPYTAKQIKVTLPYLLASRMVNHIASGVGRPFAGILNDVTFPEIIENSVNFLPVVLPGYDQKQDLVDRCINYITYYNNLPVLDTMYVFSNEYNQLNYLHNIMAIQQIIKVLRERCPSSRYTFMDSSDLQNYISDATTIINQYSTNFKEISIQYMADADYEKNNIFYATIKVKFKNFVNEEYFKVIAIDD